MDAEFCLYYPPHCNTKNDSLYCTEEANKGESTLLSSGITVAPFLKYITHIKLFQPNLLSHIIPFKDNIAAIHLIMPKLNGLINFTNHFCKPNININNPTNHNL